MISLVACSPAKFSSKDLAKTTVFGRNSDAALGVVEQPASDDASGTIGQPSTGAPATGWLGQPSTGTPGTGWLGQPSTGAPGTGWLGQPSTGAPAAGSVGQPSSQDSAPVTISQWTKDPAPGAITSQPADPAKGILPPIKPRVVCAPWHTGEGVILASEQDGVAAALYKCGPGAPINCSLVQKLDHPGGAVDLAKRLFHEQEVQFKSSSKLSAGNYYVVVFPAKKAAPASIGYTDGRDAIAPMQDSVANHLSTLPTFSVDSAGRASTGTGSYNVLVGVEKNNSRELCEQLNAGLIDPLMIDFSDEGILLSSQKDGLYFDLIGNGKLQRISWPLSGANMFLLHDKTTAGQVTGEHMFGNYTVGFDGKVATDGFDALQEYDLNGDRIVDKNDEIYSQLRLWGDYNGDGVAQWSELYTLEAMGVDSIELNAAIISETDVYGNITTLRAFIHMKNGDVRVINDVWFKAL